MEDVALEFAGRARVAKVNVDDHATLAVRYGVRSIPTLLVFREGRVVGRRVGVVPKEELVQLLEAAVS